MGSDIRPVLSIAYERKISDKKKMVLFFTNTNVAIKAHFITQKPIELVDVFYSFLKRVVKPAA